MQKFKKTRAIVAILTAVVVAVAGCGKATREPKNDPQSLENSFSAAEPATKSLAEKAVKFIQSADYGKAADSLQMLLQEKTLTPEQTQVVSNLFHEVSKYPRLAP